MDDEITPHNSGRSAVSTKELTKERERERERERA